ncbi:XisI protein [Desertifilum sp. FACHB-1129]|uniref:XisI protein n=2 Tax=Desertifilum tharense IPPAS B-1220 TaxID=1781255 RepID=A0A1E5QLW3_9CYAN|nr:MULTISPECIES: XisI protein [Desertifilum]MDA0212936.1 XisI protein [Cyanobacteria bacterium FC1]MBD2312497.1 XisI protein [Desertifilum sp. FACHB-1129]MBD2323439.1 XisI protein [Desertifilum sp. FACHB-866]MBD2333284.1 XisI protein [Desertifilum sp. FACHB-868]OEJ75665.1 hypothetical protein BH720_08475 [Desertifilum tharense IPPAS B-1220]
MAKLEQYRQYIQEFLSDSGNYGSASDEVEVQLIFDPIRDHYQILEIGWEDGDRIYSCVMHLDIKNEKIWIQRNMTDIQIAEELIKMGVPREDIILGLHSPVYRQYTQYGVA